MFAGSRLDDELLAGLVAQGLGKVLRLLDLGSRVVLRVVLHNKPTQADSLQLEPTTPACPLFPPAARRSAGPEVGMGAWQGDAQQESTRLLEARATLLAVPSEVKAQVVHSKVVAGEHVL